jgi:hypothetical protein
MWCWLEVSWIIDLRLEFKGTQTHLIRAELVEASAPFPRHFDRLSANGVWVVFEKFQEIQQAVLT